MTLALHLVSWNIGLRQRAAARFLEGAGYDVALLQEASLPQDGWERDHYDRGAKVVGLSNRATVTGLRSILLEGRPQVDEFNVSAPGTIAAARVLPATGTPFLAVSLYARWEEPHPATPTSWKV